MFCKQFGTVFMLSMVSKYMGTELTTVVAKSIFLSDSIRLVIRMLFYCL